MIYSGHVRLLRTAKLSAGVWTGLMAWLFQG